MVGVIGFDEHGREVYPWWQAWALATAPLPLAGSAPGPVLVLLLICAGVLAAVNVVMNEWPTGPRRRSTDR